MGTLFHDLRLAVRQLRRGPLFGLIAVLCVAIGVGGTTTIFTLFNALLLRPVAGINAAGLLVEIGRDGGEGTDTLPYPTWRDLRAGSDLAEITLYAMVPASIAGGEGAPEVVLGHSVTGNYFQTLGVRPSLGHFFDPAESPDNPRPVVVISEALWQQRFGGDPSVVGRMLQVNSRSVTVIGVAAAGFRGHISVLPADVWIPLGLEAPGLPTRRELAGERSFFLVGIGRLAPRATPAAVSAQLNGLMEAMAGERPFLENIRVRVSPLHNLPGFAHAPVQLFISVLLIVVALVLLIACINVAAMLLVRAGARRREMAIRQALGAGRTHLLRLFLTETLLLFGLGGAVGVGASIWASRVLAAFQPPSPPPFVTVFDLSIDHRVLLFSLAVTLATALLFGMGPALRASRTPAAGQQDLQARGSRRQWRFRGPLIAGQVAMTLVLLVGAGLFLRALGEARAIDPGFDPRGVAVISFDMQLHGYQETEGARFYERLRAEVEALPGVRAAGLTLRLPLGFPATTSFGGVNVAGFQPPAGNTAWEAPLNIVSPGYFEALGLRLLAGRDFAASDGPTQTQVAVINQAMADYFFEEGAVGRTFYEGPAESGRLYRVVGVVADSKYARLQEETGRFFYYRPLAQEYRSAMSLLVRGRSTDVPPTAPVRDIVDTLDPALPFVEVVSLSDYVAIAYLPQRLAGLVSGLFGGVGLLLAAVGIGGAAAFVVQQRLPEMGIRMALGACRGDITRLFLREGMGAPMLGIMIGLCFVVAGTRLLSSFLFGINPLDPLTILAVATLLLGVTLLANWLPLQRVLRSDPIRVLRE